MGNVLFLVYIYFYLMIYVYIIKLGKKNVYKNIFSYINNKL